MSSENAQGGGQSHLKKQDLSTLVSVVKNKKFIKFGHEGMQSVPFSK